jgi:hypothetical protein
MADAFHLYSKYRAEVGLVKGRFRGKICPPSPGESPLLLLRI